MDRKLTLGNVGSAQLGKKLEHQLAAVFANKTICKYLAIDGCGPELQILGNCDPVKTLPHIKLAFRIWSEMEPLDRHNVLGRFQRLYAELPVIDLGNQKTLVFCALFVHEFAIVLAEAMEWPD